MNKTRTSFAALGMLALSTMSAAAQDEGWDVTAATYLWLPESRTGVATRFGDVSTTLSASDAIDALDFGAMVAVDARKDDWALLIDIFYLDLTLKGAMPLGLVYSEAESRTRLSAISGYGLYTFQNGERLRFEGGAGLRVMSSDIELTMHGVTAQDYHSSLSDTWVDPVIALRTTAKLTDNVNGVLWLDAGGFDIGESSKRTWQISGMVNWQINEKWTMGAGYRSLFVEREADGVPYDLRMSGPVLGVAMRF